MTEGGYWCDDFFENLGDLQTVLKDRLITYPKGYLEQPGSSFVN